MITLPQVKPLTKALTLASTKTTSTLVGVSLAMSLTACASGHATSNQTTSLADIPAVTMTEGSNSATVKTKVSYEDYADGAIWVSKDNATQLFISTQEGDGLSVFDKHGNELIHDSTREAAGADIRYGIKASDDDNITADILAVGLPDEGAIGFYRVTGNASQPLTFLNALEVDVDPEVVCLGKNITTGELIATVGEGDNSVSQYKLNYQAKTGTVNSTITDDAGKAVAVRHIDVGGEISGCTVDDQTGTLYIAEQDLGIWVYGSEPENIKDRKLLDSIEPLGHLVEAEGIDIIYRPDGKGYIIIADEAKGLVIYERDSHEYVTTVHLDGFEEHKGLALAPNAIWLMNSELEEPLYERVDVNDFAKIAGINLNDAVSVADLSATTLKLVSPVAETAQVDDDGDAADDSVTWINQQNPSNSLIIATNKQGGMMAYNLDGKELQYLNKGRPNNVDLRQNVTLGDGKTYDLAAATNRDNNSITLYHIDGNSQTPIQKLNLVGNNTTNGELISAVDEVYGLCMGQNSEGTYVFANGKNGVTEQWAITADGNGIHGEKVRTLTVGSQPEGCVADDSTNTLYVGEEDVAIWTFDMRANASTTATKFADVDGVNIVADVEGITLYNSPTTGSKYLIASSQGNNSYSVYDLNNNNTYKGSFAIKGDDRIGVDGTSDTDGIDVVSANLGSDYPQGLFVAQDFYNVDAEYSQENQNFKMVSWADIAKQLNLK